MYEQIRRNRRASWLLMAVVVVILLGPGLRHRRRLDRLAPTAASASSASSAWPRSCWSLIGYYAGDRMVLAVSGARRITHDEEPQLCNVVEEMTIAGGLGQPPAVYVIEDPAPNAFATGRDPAHSSVAVTSGLLEKMNRDELQGVIAHEMSHVRNYDIRFATLVGILVGLIALVADFFLRARWFGGGGRRGGDGGGGGRRRLHAHGAWCWRSSRPLAARIVQFAISRRRELLADAHRPSS